VVRFADNDCRHASKVLWDEDVVADMVLITDAIEDDEDCCVVGCLHVTSYGSLLLIGACSASLRAISNFDNSIYIY